MWFEAIFREAGIGVILGNPAILIFSDQPKNRGIHDGDAGRQGLRQARAWMGVAFCYARPRS